METETYELMRCYEEGMPDAAEITAVILNRKRRTW
jgi:hypothetical protein